VSILATWVTKHPLRVVGKEDLIAEARLTSAHRPFRGRSPVREYAAVSTAGATPTPLEINVNTDKLFHSLRTARRCMVCGCQIRCQMVAMSDKRII